MPAILVGLWLAALASPLGLTWVFIGVTVLIAAVMDVVLAQWDVRALARAGYDDQANPYSAVVPVVYLFRRGHLCAARNLEGYGPAWLHVGIVALLVLAVAVAQLVSGATSMLSFFDELIGGRVTP